MTRLALQNAGLSLTTDCLIADAPALQPAGARSMAGTEAPEF